MNNNYKPLYVWNDKVLLYRGGSIYLSDKDNTFEIIKCPLSSIKRIASKIRLSNRLLRLEPRATERLSENKFIMCFAHKIWIVDIAKRIMNVAYENRQGWSDTLNFCSDGKNIYWGEYGSNPERDEVNIYKISQDEKIEVVYTFPKQTIRHIHNIFFDATENCFWIFTGDNDTNAGIYRASKDWTKVQAVRTGEQRYRTVVGFPYEGGVIYATDSVSDANHIYVLNKDGALDKLAAINGSCIYGTETMNHYIFSTTVEPPEGAGFLSMLSNKLGGGILSRDVEVVSVRKSDLKVSVIAKYRKDWLPMKFFQYGVAMFPKGQEQSEMLWHYVMACKKYDGKSLLIDLD